MNKGIMGKVLFIDLTNQTHEIKYITEDIYEKFVGGKGLATWLLYEGIKSYEKIQPLEEENQVIFAAGPLTGTDAPAMRGVVVSISPLTGVYVDSYYGGHFSQEIKYAGFDAVVLKGKSFSPVVISVEDDKVEFIPGDSYWGLDALQVNHKIKEDLKDETLKIASIGQAGENLVPYALVSCEYNRQAGRGGIGAVMGSKKIKALALRGTNLVKISDENKFKQGVTKGKKELKDSEPAQELTESGTAAALWFAHTEGLMPVRNYQKGTFDPTGLDHEAQNKSFWLRDVGCASCPIRCSKVGVIKKGKRKGTISDIVEYETAALMGANLELDDINEVAYLVNLCDELGLDGMSAGSAIGFAMECFEKGILKPEDCEGIKLTFGSKANISKALEMIANKEGKLGKLLAMGAKAASEELGEEAKQIASHVKGMDIPAWGPRGTPGMGLAYMTADRGACHQRAFPIDYEVGGTPFNGRVLDRLEVKGKAETVVADQNLSAGLDSFVKCDFGTFGISVETYIELFEGSTGKKIDEDCLNKLGERTWNLSRIINLKQGMTYKDEKLPKRFYEPLPDGPAKDHKFTREDEEVMLSEYYSHRGWDKEGKPTEDKLKSLGLFDII